MNVPAYIPHRTTKTKSLYLPVRWKRNASKGLCQHSTYVNVTTLIITNLCHILYSIWPCAPEKRGIRIFSLTAFTLSGFFLFFSFKRTFYLYYEYHFVPLFRSGIVRIQWPIQNRMSNKNLLLPSVIDIVIPSFHVVTLPLMNTYSSKNIHYANVRVQMLMRQRECTEKRSRRKTRRRNRVDELYLQRKVTFRE